MVSQLHTHKTPHPARRGALHLGVTAPGQSARQETHPWPKYTGLRITGKPMGVGAGIFKWGSVWHVSLCQIGLILKLEANGDISH
jgi:hypothetical protein